MVCFTKLTPRTPPSVIILFLNSIRAWILLDEGQTGESGDRRAIQGCSEARVGSLLNDEDEDNGEESKHLKDYSAPRVGSFLVAACSVITQRIAHFSIASRGQTWGVQFWVYSVIRTAQCPCISNIMFSFYHVCLIHTWYLSQPSHHITSHRWLCKKFSQV